MEAETESVNNRGQVQRESHSLPGNRPKRGVQRTEVVWWLFAWGSDTVQLNCWTMQSDAVMHGQL